MNDKELKSAAFDTRDKIENINDIQHALEALVELIGGSGYGEQYLAHVSGRNLSYLIQAVGNQLGAAVQRAGAAADNVHEALVYRARQKATPGPNQ